MAAIRNAQPSEHGAGSISDPPPPYCPHCDHCNAARVDGHNIWKKRRELGIRQKDLAAALHVSKSYISDIENNRYPIRFSRGIGKRIAEYLNL